MMNSLEDEELETECVLLATKEMGGVTPADNRFYRMLTEKANEAHKRRVHTASTRKIRRNTVKDIYATLIKHGKIRSSPSKKGSKTPNSTHNRSSSSDNSSVFPSSTPSSTSSATLTSSSSKVVSVPPLSNTSSKSRSPSNKFTTSLSSSGKNKRTRSTPADNLVTSPSAPSAHLTKRKRGRNSAGATPENYTTVVMKRETNERYVKPANLPALRTVVSLCRKRLSDCSYDTESKAVVGLDKQQRELQELLERTLLESENNSVLLIGARGSGKSLLTEHVLKVAREKYKRVENDQGESMTAKRKRSNATKNLLSPYESFPNSSSRTKSFKSSTKSSTATRYTNVGSSSSSSSPPPPPSSSSSNLFVNFTKTKKRRTNDAPGPRTKSLTKKARVFFLYDDPSNTTPEELSFAKRSLKHSLITRKYQTRDDKSHVVMSSDDPTLSVNLAMIFVQCRESLYDGDPPFHIVRRDWLVDSQELKFLVEESNYSFLSGCQRRRDRLDGMNNMDDDNGVDEAKITSIEHSVEDMEKKLNLNLDDIFLITEDDGENKKLPLENILIYVCPSALVSTTQEQLKYLIEISGGKLITNLPIGSTFNSLNSRTELPFNIQAKKRVMIIGTLNDLDGTNNIISDQLASLGISYIYPIDTLLRVVLSAELSLDTMDSISSSGINNGNTSGQRKTSFDSSLQSPFSSNNFDSNSPRSHRSTHSNSTLSPFSPQQPELSAYELARLEQIKENEEALRALGIIGARLGGGPSEQEKEEQARREREKRQNNLLVRELRKERQRRQKLQEEARKSPFMVVRLNGIMHSDESGEKRALEEISRQMFQDVKLTFSNRISFAQHLKFLFDMLREMKGLDSALIFILDEFDSFAVSHKKQMLLYTLLDLQQSGEVKMLVIGLTERLDIADQLEKRVKSRFSNRQIYIPPLSMNDLILVMVERLTITNADVSVSSNTKTIGAGVRRKWNTNIERILNDRSLQNVIKRYHHLGHSTRWFCRRLLRAVSGLLDPSRKYDPKKFQVLTEYDIIAAFSTAPPSVDRGAQLFKSLTVAELLLIISMCSLEKKSGLSGSYNFHMAHGELQSLFSLENDIGAASGMQYRYDKKIFYKALEHLVMLGIVQPVGQHIENRFLSQSSLLASRDAQPSDCIIGDQALRVVLPRRQIQELIREIDEEKNIPTIVKGWAAKWL
jgi:Cdc6-like AAA superfamily ATPase